MQNCSWLPGEVVASSQRSSLVNREQTYVKCLIWSPKRSAYVTQKQRRRRRKRVTVARSLRLKRSVWSFSSAFCLYLLLLLSLLIVFCPTASSQASFLVSLHTTDWSPSFSANSFTPHSTPRLGAARWLTPLSEYSHSPAGNIRALKFRSSVLPSSSFFPSLSQHPA